MIVAPCLHHIFIFVIDNVYCDIFSDLFPVIQHARRPGSYVHAYRFYRVTQLREGDTKHTERRHRELQLDRVLSRILTTLAFAARASTGQEGLAAALNATPKQLAAMTRRLLPEFQSAFVEDVSAYCGLCERLRRCAGQTHVHVSQGPAFHGGCWPSAAGRYVPRCFECFVCCK